MLFYEAEIPNLNLQGGVHPKIFTQIYWQNAIHRIGVGF
jgi:hypothetical protein